jgi:conjugative transfer region protein TrbK
MSSYLTSQQFLRVAAVAFMTLAATVAVIQSRRGREAAALAPLGRGEADALVSELARCRTITSDDALVLDACRRIWAENRRHFFVPTKSPQLPDPPVANAPAGLMKSQERVQPHEVDQSRTR